MLHPVLGGLEEWFQDGCFVNRGNRRSEARVVIVQLDDASLAEIHKPLAFISDDLSRVIDDLHRRGAAAIGLDLMIPEDLDNFPELHAELVGNAAARAGNVVMPVFDVHERLIRPLEGWRDGAALFGLVEVTADEDHFLSASFWRSVSAGTTITSSRFRCSKWPGWSTTKIRMGGCALTAGSCPMTAAAVCGSIT